jgi:hypothetical protein
MNAEPGKLYLAIMHHWLWRPSAIRGSNLEQRECKIARVFDSTTANLIGVKVTDLQEIAEFVITLANSWQPINKEQRIRLEVYEVTNPILVSC